MSQVRPAAVAGSFYPGDASRLGEEVAGLLAAARVAGAPDWPKALIVPHAGYVYSGPVAASAYARLAPARGIVTRVVLLGPTHRVAIRGLALPEATAFATPLGEIPIDAGARRALAGLPFVGAGDLPHAQEHSLEVQLPFLQAVLGDFSLVPLAVGSATPEQVAQALERLWGGRETVIVISTDLSHFLSYEQARRVDQATVDRILDLNPDLNHQQACGATPLNGMLLAARTRGMSISLLDLANSGDTAGDRNRVVGYSAFQLRENTAPDTAARGRVLVGLARAAIANTLGAVASVPASPPWLAEQGATFVTLTKGGQLRGCIGSLEAHRPLGEDVAANARAAAFRDPRFKPVSFEEFPLVDVEVSLLSSLSPIEFQGRDGALAALRPGVDGVVLEWRRHRGTFLPQVWEQLPRPEDFLARLMEKAGLTADFWADDLRLYRYTVEKWRERDFQH